MRAIPVSLHAPHSVPWSHTRPPRTQARRARARGACRPRPGPLHGPWRLLTITRTPHSPSTPGSARSVLVFTPWESYQQHARARHPLLASCVGRAVRVFVAAASPRPGWKHALRTPRGRHSGHPSAQQARATHWATAQPRALAASDFWQGALRVLCTPRPLGCAPRQSRIAPPCPADASLSALTAGGMCRASLLCAGGQGTLPASGKASCARCARRDRSGAPRGQATLLR